MGFKQIEKYMDMFDKEVEELKKIQATGTVQDYTRAKMNRREELEDKFAEFEIEREERLARRGESRREGDIEEEEDPKDQGQLKSPWDRPKPKKGAYPSVGPMGPGDLNVEGDWERPIELFEFEYEEEGWINCTTGYYWHSVLGGGIYQHEDKWYRHWEFNYKPPEKEIVQEEPKTLKKKIQNCHKLLQKQGHWKSKPKM